MLQQAARKSTPALEPAFVLGDATKLPFGENGFHAATIAFAMHDVPHEIGVMLLKEARRVLIPGGQITIIDYNEPGKHFFARILYLIANLYESPNYSFFIKRGLDQYLEEANLVVSSRFTIFGGVQVVSCR
jgi:ubiquinone/menaquinone biosynthesis C-methylase UbiE